MSARDDGGPAFPAYETETGYVHSPGMTLRDWFAGQALAVAYRAEEDAPTGANNEITYKGIATRAYHLADALLAARDSKP